MKKRDGEPWPERPIYAVSLGLRFYKKKRGLVAKSAERKNKLTILGRNRRHSSDENKDSTSGSRNTRVGGCDIVGVE